MLLHTFRARTYRNINACDISFGPGVHLLVGENAQGKTNVMEGIYFFAGGKSFKGATDADMTKIGDNGFSLSLDYEDKTGQNNLSYRYYDGARKRLKNEIPLGRIGDMMGNFRAVLFTPDHLALVKDSPEERRNFLNIGISQCYPVYVKLYADYKKALEERNCLLKMANKGLYFDASQLDAWSESLANYASHIYLFRKKYTDSIGVYAKELLSQMSEDKEILTVRYKSSILEDSCDRAQIAEQYKRLFTENLHREIGAGVTLFGPNRDDLDIDINGISVRSFASQGQQRSTVLALKFAEGEVCREYCGEYPVYLLDDVMSELDGRRRTFLQNGMEEKQVIMTTCDPNHVTEADSVIHVKGGTYVSSYR